MTFAQAAQTAAAAGVKRLWLTHYSQKLEEPSEYLTNATGIFADTECGYDGMSTVLEFEK